jgi:hypothetical protein
MREKFGQLPSEHLNAAVKTLIVRSEPHNFIITNTRIHLVSQRNAKCLIHCVTQNYFGKDTCHPHHSTF